MRPRRAAAGHLRGTALALGVEVIQQRILHQLFHRDQRTQCVATARLLDRVIPALGVGHVHGIAGDRRLLWRNCDRG
ncbi:hypothetical protein G6F45_013882 [Rhizopus arrhizus]|nr:hypothetical protein G6F45_013882 [Rhizopus arrhizus]